MILYHFTAREYLPSILEEGLTKGEVPTSAYGPAPNAVWFTSDGSPQGHGLSDEKILSPEEVQVMRRMHGVDYPDDLMFPNKKAIRIKVKLPSSDRRLFHWPAWSRKRMSRQWLDALHKAGGPRWRTWYIYFGVVPPSDFLEVLDMTTGEPAAVLAEAD
ncbi:MAG TPA: hypothetical protein VIS03_08360 [Kiloniellaceae bacterium]